MTDKQATEAMDKEYIVITKGRKGDRAGRFAFVFGYCQELCGGYDTKEAARRRARDLSREFADTGTLKYNRPEGQYCVPYNWGREFRVMVASRKRNGQRKSQKVNWEDGYRWFRSDVPAFKRLARYRSGVEVDR